MEIRERTRILELILLPAESLRSFLRPHGAHRDVAVPSSVFAKHRDEVSRTDVSLYDAPSYRDDKPRYSVHLTDHRAASTPRDTLIAHLEWFNPEHHPVLHALVDFPLWYCWNRVLRPEPIRP